MFGSQVIEHFFISVNLNSEAYVNMLRNQILSAIENVSGPNFPSVRFQQDGGHPLYGIQVRST